MKLHTFVRNILIAIGFVMASYSVVWACTGIMLTGSDGSIVRARTVEWGPFDLKPTLDIVPRGYVYDVGKMPDGRPGATWAGKYGVVGTSMLGHPTPGDGINEAGLSAGLFYLPGFTEYQSYDPDAADRSIAGINLAGYVLSMFETVDEVREGLKNIRVVAIDDPKLGFPFPLHMLVADRHGGRIVVEYIGGKPVVFDAPLGVITNSPTYDWHLTNLRNYINLSGVSLPTRTVAGNDFAPLGAGSGMIGLPGDFTPPSRFVRAAAFSHSARKTSGAYDTVREAFRILDNFNIPIGAAEGAEDDVESGDLLYSATQWTTAADSTNLKFYFHTQFDRRVHVVDLKRIDFGADKSTMHRRSIGDSGKPTLVDMTPGG